MAINANYILAIGGAALAGIIALLSIFRAGRAIDRWMFVAGLAVLATEQVCLAFLANANDPSEMFHWQLMTLTATAPLPGIWLLFSLTYARGNARQFLRRWQYVLAAAFLVPILAALIFPSELLAGTTVPADGTHFIFQLGSSGTALHLVQLIASVLILMNLERTFRAAVGTVRWRIKFMLLGTGALFLVRLYTASQVLLFRSIDPSLGILGSGALIVACLLILRSLFRAGHFDLDVHPSQSVLQGSVTVLLAGVYLLIVGVFAKIVSYLGGDSSFAAKTLVVLVLLVLLALLLQSDRVQLQLRRFISRHFQRPLYDYRTVWRKFTEGTASRVEQAEFCRAVTHLLADIFQSLSITFWLVDGPRGEMILAASTSVSGRQAEQLKPDSTNTAAVVRHFQEHPDPVDIEKVADEWAAALRRCHPDEFHKGGTRIGVPIVSNGEVLAVIIVGDRVAGAAFTLQDLDLLKSIADQVASGLLNVRLSQRLLQAREHEAFQTMAAFFVHDLKNAANTLNLMLQNLPDHFDDPAFREDALRGMGKSVAHINHLISRLGELRRELKISAQSSDLNEIVSGTLSDFSSTKEFSVVWQPAALPALPVDREQFAKVVTNLVLNAKEAGAGQLVLGTHLSAGWGVLEASDNGSGMSPEFLARSLFRPFQTTKKNGLGIGMFQSKMIVEAHGGRMLVSSTPNQGTTFRVFLPLAGKDSRQPWMQSLSG